MPIRFFLFHPAGSARICKEILVNNNKRPRPGLRHAREQLGLTQQELANRLGTTKVAISRWENGSIFPTQYYRQRLCKALGKTLAELDLVPMPEPPALPPSPIPSAS